MTAAPRLVHHEPVWEPAVFAVDAAGNTKPGYHCVHQLENGSGPCESTVFTLDQAIGNHCCFVVDQPARFTTARPVRWESGGGGSGVVDVRPGPDGSRVLRINGGSRAWMEAQLTFDQAEDLGIAMMPTRYRDAEPDGATFKPTRYTASLLPEDHDAFDSFAIHVDYFGDRKWIIRRHRKCLGADGTWCHDSGAAWEDPEWVAAHLHTFGRATMLAAVAAKKVTLNGWTAAEVLAGKRNEPAEARS